MVTVAGRVDSGRDGAAGFVQFLLRLILKLIEFFPVCGIPLGPDLRQSGLVGDLDIKKGTASVFIIKHVLSQGLQGLHVL